MDKIEIELEHDVNEDVYYQAWGFRTDEKFYFYYDESNNCRKFWIKPADESGKFNTDVNLDFVLAGVACEESRIEVDFENLKRILKLQKNTIEIKFKTQFSIGNFLDCMKNKRVTSMLEWIDTNNLYIHYSHVNNLYYTLVEIIDSITSPEEIDEYKFDYFSVKNTFYKMLAGKEISLQKLMYKYCYPNIKSEDIEQFCNSLLKLFEIKYRQTTEEKFITGLIKRAAKSDELIFVQNNEDYIMQENYVEFYVNPIRTYQNSEHIFDEEQEIQEAFNKYRFTKNGVEINNFKFVDSKTDALVQVSDVMAGILGKMFSYINVSDLRKIRQDVNALNDIQATNILLLNKLRAKSDMKNRGFLHSITAQCEIDKLNMLFDLVSSKVKAAHNAG